MSTKPQSDFKSRTRLKITDKYPQNYKITSAEEASDVYTFWFTKDYEIILYGYISQYGSKNLDVLKDCMHDAFVGFIRLCHRYWKTTDTYSKFKGMLFICFRNKYYGAYNKSLRIDTMIEYRADIFSPNNISDENYTSEHAVGSISEVNGTLEDLRNCMDKRREDLHTRQYKDMFYDGIFKYIDIAVRDNIITDFDANLFRYYYKNTWGYAKLSEHSGIPTSTIFTRVRLVKNLITKMCREEGVNFALYATESFLSEDDIY